MLLLAVYMAYMAEGKHGGGGGQGVLISGGMHIQVVIRRRRELTL